MKTYYVMVNTYRSSTSDGSANTWQPRRCIDRKHQHQIITQGLPVNDTAGIDEQGRRYRVNSTKGLRLPTSTERHQAAQQAKRDGYYSIPEAGSPAPQHT